jgi:hypothetical protein
VHNHEELARVMASWLEVREMLERYLGAERLTDEVLRVPISLVDDQGEGSAGSGSVYVKWDVYVRLEEIPRKDGGQGLEFVAIDAAVGAVGQIDLMSAVAHVGQLVQGALAYAQGTDSGTLSVGTRVPTGLIEVNKPETFLSLLYDIGGAARAVISELRTEDGRFAYRGEQIRESSWHSIRRLVLTDTGFAVDRDLGNGFIFSIDGVKEPGRRLRMLVARNNEAAGEHYVTFEFTLGEIQHIDLRRAVEAAAPTTGGVVCDDGFVSFRVSQHLTALTSVTFASSVLQLAAAAETYLGSGPSSMP